MYKILGVLIIFVILFYYLDEYIIYFPYVSKISYSSKILNKSLYKISKILNNEKINDWFIGYGTLLGIIRNNSCINKDDDIDIIIDIKHKYLIDNIITKYNFKLLMDRNYFYKICIDRKLATIDFYFCIVDNSANYTDNWENVVWTNVKPIKKINWNDTTLNIPNNYEKKLINRYGENWRTPIHNYKGVKNKYL